MSVSKFSEKVPTWRVYPRVHYFIRRYRDLLPRFSRVTGTFPKSFQNQNWLSSITEISNDFSKELEVNVIGWQKLDLSHIVVSMKPWKQERFIELKGPARISFYICYANLEKLDTIGLKKMTEVLEYFSKNIAQKNSDDYSTLFIVIDVENQEELQEEFRRNVLKVVRKHLQVDWDYPENVIFGSHGSILGSKISEFLESRLICGFHKVLAYLQQFIRKTKHPDADTIDILQSDLVVDSIQSLLRDVKGIADMRAIDEANKSMETEEMDEQEKFLYQFMKKLAQIVKCGVVEPMSAKYNMPPRICNLLLDEIKFETKIVESVSRNTRYHLSKLNTITKDRKSILKKGKFDFIVNPLQNDMSKVISDAEKTMASAAKVIVVMEKMVFEVEGYLEQTITEKYEPQKQSKSLPAELKKAILELKDVHAVGTIYDVCEVHVDKESEDLIKDLSQLMRKYSYTYPYKVKTVTQHATAMMADIQHENGKLIKSPFPDNMSKYREGTLGAFVQADNSTLYAITCAHVVSNPNKEEHEVYIQDRGLRLRKFGKSSRKLTICTGTGTLPLIDIAAVLVDLSFVRQCIRRMKDDNGINRPAVVAEETVVQLSKRFVYKHGAMSGLTRGIICSSDFCVRGSLEEEEYFLMIESLPGDEYGCFAKKGDSGAVICTPAVDNDTIKVISMLSGGNYTLTGQDTQDKFLSFLMKTGLQKLRERSNVALNIP